MCGWLKVMLGVCRLLCRDYTGMCLVMMMGDDVFFFSSSSKNYMLCVIVTTELTFEGHFFCPRGTDLGKNLQIDNTKVKNLQITIQTLTLENKRITAVFLQIL